MIAASCRKLKAQTAGAIPQESASLREGLGKGFSLHFDAGANGWLIG